MQKNSRRIQVVVLMGLLSLLVWSVSVAQDTITLADAAIQPESIEYNPATDTFLVSSIATGTIYEVAADGTVTPFIQDEALVSSAGIMIDAARNRLLVVTSGLGQILGQLGQGGFPGGQFPEGFPTPDPSQFPGGVPQPGQLPPGFDPSQLPEGFALPDFTIRLLAFDLTSKEQLFNVDLTNVAPAGRKFANDITVDADGNVYVTDSLAGAVYRVDATGSPTFLSHVAFTGEGLGVNGIEFRDGSLIVGKTSDGTLYKVPLDNPQNVTQVQVPEALTGADGITFTADGKLLVVSGQGTLYVLSSTDSWATAAIDQKITTPSGAAAATLRDQDIYVLVGGLQIPMNAVDAAATPPTPQIVKVTAA